MRKTINDRKNEHINIVLNNNVEPVKSSFLKYKINYKALVNIDFKKIDTTTNFLDSKLSFPFLIGSMTGGGKNTLKINKNLAIAANKARVALALGSMRIILKDKESLKTFQVRKYCKDIPLLANFGLVQLNYGYCYNDINYLIDSIEADGICLHLNHLQEAIQPEGDTNFENILRKLELIINKIKKPIIIKEVGAGLDRDSILKLNNIGIKYFDIAGLGGTNWTSVESYRRKDDLGFIFQEIGNNTTDVLEDISDLDVFKISSGGIRNGLDIFKSLALGANLTSIAGPILKNALNSPIKTYNQIMRYKKELEIAMFCVGVDKIKKIKRENIKNENN